jgi:hypothetical protein
MDRPHVRDARSAARRTRPFSAAAELGGGQEERVHVETVRRDRPGSVVSPSVT